jgi:alkanesulfonate monooxygenase SsuD/methylene tetrahydromethanopterin reductase-like flavin-dependent oxidoreductase (luciferase family)
MGAQSEGAARRAARLTDGVFFGPQVAWRDVAKLIGVFRDERARVGAAGPGAIAASRSLIVGANKEVAAASARDYLDRTFRMYRTWDMQERTMVPLQLAFDAPLDDWTVHGSPRDCVEVLKRAEQIGLDGIGLTIYSLPRGVDARIAYMEMIADEILKPLAFSRETPRG